MNEPCPLCTHGVIPHCGTKREQSPHYQCTLPWWHTGPHIACGFPGVANHHPVARWPRYAYPWGDWKPTRCEVKIILNGASIIVGLRNAHNIAGRTFAFKDAGTWLFHVPADVEVVWL